MENNESGTYMHINKGNLSGIFPDYILFCDSYLAEKCEHMFSDTVEKKIIPSPGIE